MPGSRRRNPSRTRVCTQRCAELSVMPTLAASSARLKARRSPPKASRIARAFSTERLKSGSRARACSGLRGVRFIVKCSIELSIIDSLWRELRDAAHVRLEHRRYGHRAIRVLIVLEHRHERALYRKRRAVEGVQRLRLVALRIAPARLHAPRLKGLEVAARGDLAVALLRGQPRLQVVGLGAAETDVTGAQRHGAIGNLQLPEHRLGMPREFLERCIRGIGPYDLYQLDLVELMVTDHAARVPARSAGFGAEARRMRHEPKRQVLRGHDLPAHEVGHRHFRSRNQVEAL